MQIETEIGFISGESAGSASNVPLPVESIADLAQHWPSTSPPTSVATLAALAYAADYGDTDDDSNAGYDHKDDNNDDDDDDEINDDNDDV